MHDSVALGSVVLAVLALLIGVVTRQFSGYTRFPYTIAMLLVGLAVGLLLRRAEADGSESLIVSLFEPARGLSPNMIFFVFLPALVFESAYSIDVHVFKNNAGAIVLFAVVALVAATFATAAWMLLILPESWAWGWPAALVLGALISATDPVAVVAILRELGVSKRLGVLIEGESLLNDGTAIVIFGVLMALFTGEQTSFDGGAALLRFVWVVAGGLTVGWVLAYLGSLWIEHLFNDPLSEITLTIVMAYASMIIAEAFLHVSGVMAVVTTGLWMSGTGRTKVSPEVAHFLHRFWETLGYIANTLIFFLVGVVIAEKLDHAGWSDLALVIVAYLGIMLIRFVLVLGLRPIAQKLSDGVSFKDALVVSWGGLRGAVSLALALMVAQNDKVPESVGAQILFVTAGVVFLTIFVNGTLMGRLLSLLGYDKPHISVEVQNLKAQALILDKVTKELSTLRSSPELSACQRGEVLREIDARRSDVNKSLDDASQRLVSAPDEEREMALWRRVLSLERQAYWEALDEGTLSGHAARILNREIARQLDAVAHGRFEPPRTRTQYGASGLKWAARLFDSKGRRFSRMTLLYDLCRAEARAASHVLDNLHLFHGLPPSLFERVQETYQRYRNTARERVEEMRVHMPEVTAAIETRLARRIELNIERDALKRLSRDGLLSDANAEQELDEIESRMEGLHQSATEVPIAETAVLVAEAPLFSGLDAIALSELSELTEELILPPQHLLFSEGDKGDSLYVIARGAIHVKKSIRGKETLVDVLGGGELLGEMALLSGESRTATAVTATPATLGRVTREGLERLMTRYPDLRSRILKEVAWRRFDNLIRPMAKFANQRRAERRSWFERSACHESDVEQSEKPQKWSQYFLATGSVEIAGQQRNSPQLFELAAETECVFSPGAYWVELSES